MKFKNYLLEIKNRLLLLSLCCFFVILVCSTFKEILLFCVIKQSIYLDQYCKESFYFIFTDVLEIFYVYIVLIFFINNQVLFWYFFYNLLLFISPGLYKKEYFYFVFIYNVSLFLFILAVVLYHSFFFPFSWNFFLSFQNFDVMKMTTLYFESKISEYFLFYTSFYYVYIFNFQIFVFLFVIFDFLKIKEKVSNVKTFRKFFYSFFICFSTFVTPPDVFSQLSLSFFLIFSYEITMFSFLFLNK